MINIASLACVLFLACCMHSNSTFSQDSVLLRYNILNNPETLLRTIDRKSETFITQMTKATRKSLKKLMRQELKMKEIVNTRDSAAARDVFGNITETYKVMTMKLSSLEAKGGNTYNGHADSMTMMLQFFDKNGFCNEINGGHERVQNIVSKYSQLRSHVNALTSIQAEIKTRQEYLKTRLTNLPLSALYRRYQKRLYYYKARMKECKAVFENPDRAERNALSLVNQLPEFRTFFAKHSELASIFRLPGNDDLSAMPLTGLQTSASLTKYIEEKFGKNHTIRQSISTNVVDAKSKLEYLKAELAKKTQQNKDAEMPDFRPNLQRSKSFVNRLEVGANFQSARNASILPIYTEVALTVGYKINDRSIAGIGASYRMGWGQDFHHIRLSHQGMGLRSFIDIKLKSSFWFSGGGELSYWSSFKNLDILKTISPWQKSIVTGISKKMKFKKTNGNIQLLYDFLHAAHLPTTQPLIFRVGYGLK